MSHDKASYDKTPYDKVFWSRISSYLVYCSAITSAAGA